MDVLLFCLADMVDEQYQPKRYEANQKGLPPLGLLYIAQVLSNKGYSVKVYDQNVTGVPNDELLETIIKKNDPHVIGFSLLIHNYFTTSDLVCKVKAWNPNLTIVAGNYIPTFYPDQLMKADPGVDFCIRGEGEFSFLNLVDHVFKNKTNLHEISGLSYRENGITKSTLIQGHVKNLDEIPIPDRKLVDFNYRLQQKSTSMITSRGCPFKCTFCYFEGIMGHVWRPRSVKNIMDEILMLNEQGYKEVLVGDSNFVLNKKRTLELCAEMKRNQVDDMTFSGDTRVDRVDYNILRSMVKAHFGQLLFGIESGNQRILNYYCKGTTIDQIKQAVKTAKKAQFDVIFGSFIVGAPDETADEIITTLKFANKLDLTFAAFQVLNTLPISPIYRDIVNRGYYKPKDDDWKRWIEVPDVSPVAVPKHRLTRLMDEGFAQFWSNPKRIFQFVKQALVQDTYMDYTLATLKNALQKMATRGWDGN
jgi:anaerobic magnesium-protoporphyrin IX monomethyl ester cyclase